MRQKIKSLHARYRINNQCVPVHKTEAVSKLRVILRLFNHVTPLSFTSTVCKHGANNSTPLELLAILSELKYLELLDRGLEYQCFLLLRKSIL